MQRNKRNESRKDDGQKKYQIGVGKEVKKFEERNHGKVWIRLIQRKKGNEADKIMEFEQSMDLASINI